MDIINDLIAQTSGAKAAAVSDQAVLTDQATGATLAGSAIVAAVTNSAQTNPRIACVAPVEGASGVVEGTTRRWRFIPDNQLRIQDSGFNERDSNRIYAEPPIPVYSYPYTEQFLDEMTDPLLTSPQAIEKYKYFFGIDRIQAEQRSVAVVSGRIFPAVSVIPGKKLCLSANYVCPQGSSIEFSILDGTKEIAILPIEDSKIIDEKMFFGLPTRFTINYDQPIVIKRDNIVTNKTIGETIHTNDSLYTIDYTPLAGQFYYPEKAEIQIKVIQRLYDTTALPPYITNIVLHQYGRTTYGSN